MQQAQGNKQQEALGRELFWLEILIAAAVWITKYPTRI